MFRLDRLRWGYAVCTDCSYPRRFFPGRETRESLFPPERRAFCVVTTRSLIFYGSGDRQMKARLLGKPMDVRNGMLMLRPDKNSHVRTRSIT